MKNNKLVTTAIVALVVGFGAGYFAHTAPAAQAPSARSGFAGTYGGIRGGANGNGMLSGTVAAKDSGSITLNTRDGSSHVVLITPATTVSKSVGGTVSDVSVGSTVIVSGTTNSDGSTSASNIQLRPAMPAPTAPQVQ